MIISFTWKGINKRKKIWVIPVVLIIVGGVVAYFALTRYALGPVFSGKYICTKGVSKIRLYSVDDILEFKVNGEVYIIQKAGPTILGKYDVELNRIDIIVEALGIRYIFRGEIKNNKIVMDDGTILEKM